MADQRQDRLLDQRGIALLTVLWGLVLLSALAAGLSATARLDARAARNLIDAARARALTEAGVTRAGLSMLAAADAGGLRALSGRTEAFTTGDGTVRVAFQDEAGRIDLNLASRETLAAVFTAAGVSDAGILADAVVRRRTAGPSFAAVEDLARVPGVAASVYAGVESLLTVHSRSSRVNPETASRPVLALLETTTVPAPAVGRLSVGEATPPPARAFSVVVQAVTDNGARHAVEAVIALTGRSSDPVQVLAWREAGSKWTD